MVTEDTSVLGHLGTGPEVSQDSLVAVLNCVECGPMSDLSTDQMKYNLAEISHRLCQFWVN